MEPRPHSHCWGWADAGIWTIFSKSLIPCFSCLLLPLQALCLLKLLWISCVPTRPHSPTSSVRPCLFLSLASSGSCQSILSQLYPGALIHLRPFSLQLKLGIRISCLYLKRLSPGFHLRPHSPSALTWLRVPLFPSWYVIPRFRQAPLAHPALPWPVVNLPPLWDSTPLPSPCLSIPLAPSMTFYPPTLPLSFATPTSTLSSGSLPLTWLHKPSVPPWPSRPVVSPWLHLSSASFGSLSPSLIPMVSSRASQWLLPSSTPPWALDSGSSTGSSCFWLFPDTSPPLSLHLSSPLDEINYSKLVPLK